MAVQGCSNHHPTVEQTFEIETARDVGRKSGQDDDGDVVAANDLFPRQQFERQCLSGTVRKDQESWRVVCASSALAKFGHYRLRQESGDDVQAQRSHPRLRFMRECSLTQPSHGMDEFRATVGNSHASSLT